MKAVFDDYMGISEKRPYIDCFPCRFWDNYENECSFKGISVKVSGNKFNSCIDFKLSFRSVSEILREMAIRGMEEFSIGVDKVRAF